MFYIGLAWKRSSRPLFAKESFGADSNLFLSLAHINLAGRSTNQVFLYAGAVLSPQHKFFLSLRLSTSAVGQAKGRKENTAVGKEPVRQP